MPARPRGSPAAGGTARAAASPRAGRPAATVESPDRNCSPRPPERAAGEAPSAGDRSERAARRPAAASGAPSAAAICVHEIVLLLLGSGTLVASALTAARFSEVPASLPLAVATYAIGIFSLSRRRSRFALRARMLSSVCFGGWFYSSVRWLVPALGGVAHDDFLLRADGWLFGQTPAAWLRGRTEPWLFELFSASYLFFEAYVAFSLARALRGPPRRARRFHDVVLSTFAIGYAGYLLLPAVGPFRAFPELFGPVDVSAGTAGLTHWIVTRWSSLFDVFPSLHIAVTLVLLEWDWRYHRRTFIVVLPAAVLTMVSTVALGYHYGVDVVAGALLWLLVRLWIRPPSPAARARPVAGLLMGALREPTGLSRGR